MAHKNEGGILTVPHKWTRKHGYQPITDEEQKAQAEADAVAAEDTSVPVVDVNSSSYKEAVNFVVSRGYSQEAAEFIVKREGVSLILDSKKAWREAPVPQAHIQAPADAVDAEPAAEKEEEDSAADQTA